MAESNASVVSRASVVLRWWDRIEETLVGLLGLLALVIGLLQVIGRYFDPARAISYAEEVIVYLIIWAIMIASSQLVRRDGHVRPDLVLRLLPPRRRRLRRHRVKSSRARPRPLLRLLPPRHPQQPPRPSPRDRVSRYRLPR